MTTTKTPKITKNDTNAAVAEALLGLTKAVERISAGGSAPSGFEALCMAIGGPGVPGNETLVQTIEDAGTNIAAGLESVAHSIHELAVASRMQAEAHQKLAGWVPTLIGVLNTKRS